MPELAMTISSAAITAERRKAVALGRCLIGIISIVRGINGSLSVLRVCINRPAIKEVILN